MPENASQILLFRAHRARFILGAIFLIPMAGVLVWQDIAGGGRAVVLMLLTGFYLILDYIVLSKLVWPPEVEVAADHFRHTNNAFGIDGTYRWDQLDGPVEVRGANVSLVRMVVRDTRKRLDFAPSHFGASYAQMAEVIEQARAGRLIRPEGWQTDDPVRILRGWSIPIAIIVSGSIIAFFLW